MSFILILLIIFLSLILILFGIIFYIRFKVRSEIGVANYNMLKKEMINVIKNSAEIKKEQYSTEKKMGGITSLVEPVILRDFKDFNKDLLFSKCKTDILSILNIINKQDLLLLDKNKDLYLIRHYVEERINDLVSNELYERFKDIDITKTVIKSYYKKNGAATIELCSSVNYFYDTNIEGIECYSDVKKYTNIRTEYVYVYDESKFNKDTHISIHCPNCGAPIRDISNNCSYCGSLIDPINLKSWKINKIDLE